MKSKAVALGRPIHPMLIPFPFAFLTGAVLFDAAGWFRDVPSWWTTGGHLSLAGIATALLAAIPGVIDYLYTVPRNLIGVDHRYAQAGKWREETIDARKDQQPPTLRFAFPHELWKGCR